MKNEDLKQMDEKNLFMYMEVPLSFLCVYLYTHIQHTYPNIYEAAAKCLKSWNLNFTRR